MTTISEKVSAAVAFLAEKISRVPDLAIVLGSGLGDFAQHIDTHLSLDAEDIPHYPVPRVAGHHGKVILGSYAHHSLILIKGRVHRYEGHSPDAVTFYVHLLAALGIKTLILTNAAGGINLYFNPGDLCLITDHLDLTFTRLSFPYRFRRPYVVYDNALMRLIEHAALQHRIALHRGIYAGVLGPSYETKAEIRMLERMGADMVGMSTVVEASVAAALGLRVAALSLITNKAAGLSPEKLSHEEVQLIAHQSKEKFSALMKAILEAL
jgi:purine-nucleoside phosphorylase